MDGHHRVVHARRRFQPMIRRFLELKRANCARMNYKSQHFVEDAQALLAAGDIEIHTIDTNIHNADQEVHELDEEIHAAIENLRRAHNPNGK